MSELKVIDADMMADVMSLSGQFYRKSEADKYINLLKDKANYNEFAYKLKSEELSDTCRFYEDELRHQKYKRCEAMANYWLAVGYHCVDDKHRRRAERHRRKWLELLHENAVELAEGERPELWISPEGKLFFKNGKKEQNEI